MTVNNEIIGRVSYLLCVLQATIGVNGIMRNRIAFKSVSLGIATVLLFSVLLCACGSVSNDNESSDVTVEISQTSCEVTAWGGVCLLFAAASDGSEIEWSSSDETVAVVSDGEVTGKAPGQASIIASAGAAIAICIVTVKGDGNVDEPSVPERPSVKITISHASATVEVGAVFALYASASDGSQIVWNTANHSVATVSDGLVTGRGVGSTNIFATSGTAVAKCTVTVTPSRDPSSSDPEIDAPSGYSLVWHDEFDGDSLDMTKWGYQVGRRDSYNGAVGPDAWGNSELQYYTAGGNVSVSDGTLKITAKKERAGDADYTSARIVTRDKANWTFGYMEARMKTPTGNGMWPAFWMLPQPTGDSGTNNEYGGWAANGEIDIMEAKGRLGNVADTTLHFGGAWPQNKYLTKSTTLSSSTDQWHTYAVDWTAEYLAWIIDGKEVFRLNNDQWYSAASSSASAPFDKPFYILLNLAVGGTYDPAGTNAFLAANDFTQATMQVDYVRVFKKLK